MATHKHRLIPTFSDLNTYVADIIEMRQSIQGVETPEGEQIGPIRHALETLDNFDCSASEWSKDHIVRFQAVCIENQLANEMYPSQFLPRHDDPVIQALDQEQFFLPTKEDVKHGNWKYDNYNNNFFLDLMQLLHGADAPISSVPTTREPKPRPWKSSAREQIQAIIAEPGRHRPVTRAIASQRSQSPDSLFSADTINTSSLIYWGPRETSTHSLLHSLLKSIGSLEWDMGSGNDKFWLPVVDSSKLPIVAAGQLFECENDGAIHIWSRTTLTTKRLNSTPVCQIECKQEHHNKAEENIIAQEIAELLGMSLLNYATDTPSIECKDESYLLCCHHTSFHMSSAIVTPKYFEGIHLDELKENDYLIVKRSQNYDLAIPSQRRRAVREIMGLMRYLKAKSR